MPLHSGKLDVILKYEVLLTQYNNNDNARKILQPDIRLWEKLTEAIAEN